MKTHRRSVNNCAKDGENGKRDPYDGVEAHDKSRASSLG